MRNALRLGAKAFVVMAAATALAAPSGIAGARDGVRGRAQASIDGVALDVFTYRPSCPLTGILLVFHGTDRDAEEYRDHARSIAERACLAVYAPLFDRDRFPNWSYHRGGIAQDGVVRPRRRWTARLAPDLVAWARGREPTIAGPVYLFGHSAGGQYLSRAVAYTDLARMPEIARIVIANPATHVAPSLAERAPYGFAGAFATKHRRERLRRYLAAPITIYLGAEDTGSRHLTRSQAADRQGENRLERGRNVFEQARAEAARHGWPFGWRLTIAPGAGHSAEDMLAHEAAPGAFGLD